MAKRSGITCTISVDDSGGTARDISNDITDFSINTPKGLQDVTGLDKSAVERIFLLADGTGQLQGVFNDAANKSHAVLKNFGTIFAGQVGRTLSMALPGGSTLAMEVLFGDYQLARNKAGELTWTAPWSLSDGTVPAWS